MGQCQCSNNRNEDNEIEVKEPIEKPEEQEVEEEEDKMGKWMKYLESNPEKHHPGDDYIECDQIPFHFFT